MVALFSLPFITGYQGGGGGGCQLHDPYSISNFFIRKLKKNLNKKGSNSMLSQLLYVRLRKMSAAMRK